MPPAPLDTTAEPLSPAEPHSPTTATNGINTSGRGRRFNWDDSDDDADDDLDSVTRAAHAKPAHSGAIGGPHKPVTAAAAGRATLRRLLRLAVFVVLLIPGAADYAVQMLRDGEQLHLESFSRLTSATLMANVPLLVWSLFLAGAYASFWIVDALVGWSPAVMMKLATIYNGTPPRHFDIYMDYVTDLRRYIRWFVFLLLLVIATAVTFRPDRNFDGVDSWRPVLLRLEATLMVYSLFVLSQKLLVQVIAVRFHRTAYFDRIRETNFATDAINVLYREARKILKEKQQYLQSLELKSQRALYRNERSPTKWNWKRHVANKKSVDNVQTATIATSHSDTVQPGRFGLSPGDMPLKSAPMLKRSGSADDISVSIPDIDDGTKTNSHIASAESDQTISPDGHGLMTESDIDLSRTPHAADANAAPTATKKAWYSRLVPRFMQPTGEKSSAEQTGRSAVPKFIKLARDINVNMDIRSSQEARKVAKKIFEAFCIDTVDFLARIRQHHAKHYTIDDIHALTNSQQQHSLPENDALGYDVFEPLFDTRENALRAFNFFDKNGNGSVSKQEMKESVVAVYRDRKSLSASLRDVGSAVGKLDKMLGAFVFFIGLLCGLMIFGVALGPVLVTSMSFLLAITFMVGNAAKNVFEGIIFLFITHPYDVGDRVFIDGNNLIVKELGILTTVFDRQLVMTNYFN